MIQKKSKQAEEYYEAKKNGNYSLARQILADNQSTKNDKFQSFSLNATSNRLSIYQCPQEKNIWCGYAAIQSLLNYEGYNLSQKTIANEVYSADSSCPWYLSNGNSYDQFPVPNYLSEKTNFTYGPFPYGAAGSVSTTVSEIKSKVVSTIDYGHGVLACGTSTPTNKLNPAYPDAKITHWGCN
ncbi:C39 family peptidase [Caproicibacter fermentans]|uniref:C39 family peptidase n=1 Tax=Caproicibacter fermentans TaxID=2576756 RepID=A0A7G8T6U0_9FIRM|nr:C39 family peptidase [Caproicibacter fermentans]QNK39331.1 C39 family peptidase [Caproicibacter fermentans]